MILSDRFPPHDRGGSERIAHLHAQGLRRRGWEVAVFTSFAPDPTGAVSVADEDGLRVYRSFPLHPLATGEQPGVPDKIAELSFELWNPWMERPLRRAIAEFRPDFLHAHYIPRISFGAFARCEPSLPHLLTFHGYNYECPKGGLYRKRGEICAAKPLPCRVYRSAMVRTLERVDRVIAISHFIERRLLDSGVPRERVRWLPNGVPLTTTETPPASSSQAVLFVGRVEPVKGVDVLLRAFRRLDLPRARLRIVGSGSDVERLRAIAGDDERVEFLGWLQREQIADAYRDCRVVVLPSLWHEVMNTVICEAAAFGRPVIATDLGGNSDLVDEGVTGFLIPPADPEALADRLRRLFQSDSLADEMGEAGRRFVARFELPRHLDSLEALYAEVRRERGTETAHR